MGISLAEFEIGAKYRRAGKWEIFFAKQINFIAGWRVYSDHLVWFFFFSLGFQSVTVWEVSELVSIISKESIKAESSPNFSLTTKWIQAN